MLQDRRNAAKPDPSYDLDGDGQVSLKDYFLAKHFDTNRKGSLTSEERAKAHEAIKTGFSDKFVFGLERAGLNEEIRNSSNILKHIRILQRDGYIIQGEDFTQLPNNRPFSVMDA